MQIQDQEWEYYREEIPTGNLTLVFHTVRKKGGENIARFHDPTIASCFANMPNLIRSGNALKFFLLAEGNFRTVTSSQLEHFASALATME